MSSAKTPLVSIVIPVYNVEQYVDECLESVRQQTYENLEIIVVEDCSTDNSLKALKPHLADDRVRLLRHKQNGGLSAARNTGIEAATGEYLMFMDSDDVVDKSLVHICARASQRLNADVITYDCIPFEDGEATQSLNVNAEQLEKNCQKIGSEYFEIPHFAWLKFVRAELFKRPELRFPVGLCYEDWPFHWQLGLMAPSIYRIESGLYHYRQRRTSITGSTGPRLLDLFRVQAMVIDAVGKSADRGIQRALGNKLHDSYWSILTRIDGSLLPRAYAEAKAGTLTIQYNGLAPAYTARRRAIAIFLRFPRSVGLPAFHILRALLNFVSPARRQRVIAKSTTQARAM